MVLVFRIDGKRREIERPLVDAVALVDEFPRFTGIVAAPQRPLIRFDQRVHARRVAARERHRNAPGRAARQAISPQTRPTIAPVARFIQTVGRAAAVQVIRRAPPFPHPRDQMFRVRGIDRNARCAGPLVGVQYALPRLAAVGRTIDAARRARLVHVSEHCGKRAIWIRSIHRNLRNCSTLIQADVLPRFTGIARFPQAVAERDIITQIRLTRSDVHDVCVAWCNGDRTDGTDRLLIENRVPRYAAVDRLKEAA